MKPIRMCGQDVRCVPALDVWTGAYEVIVLIVSIPPGGDNLFSRHCSIVATQPNPASEPLSQLLQFIVSSFFGKR